LKNRTQGPILGCYAIEEEQGKREDEDERESDG
jgi:hypothetical protein